MEIVLERALQVTRPHRTLPFAAPCAILLALNLCGCAPHVDSSGPPDPLLAKQVALVGYKFVSATGTATEASGPPIQKILLTWKNNGPKSIATLSASIKVYDANRQPTSVSVDNEPVFDGAVNGRGGPVLPGQTHTDSDKAGTLILQMGSNQPPAVIADVVFTEATGK